MSWVAHILHWRSQSVFSGREIWVTNLVNLLCARDWGLQSFPMNVKCPVSASHKLGLIMSQHFVHTAHRYYRFNDLVRYLDWCAAIALCGPQYRQKDDQNWLFRGSKVVTRPMLIWIRITGPMGRTYLYIRYLSVPVMYISFALYKRLLGRCYLNNK